MPSLGIAPHPGGCAGPAMMPAQDAAPVSGVFPAGASFHLLEIRVQAIQLLAISRGSRNAPSHTPGHGRYFPGMLLSPSGFPSRSAIRPRNLPSSSSRLSRGYNRAPRGAVAAEADAPAHRGDGCLCRLTGPIAGWKLGSQDRRQGQDLSVRRANTRRSAPLQACRRSPHEPADRDVRHMFTNLNVDHHRHAYRRHCASISPGPTLRNVTLPRRPSEPGIDPVTLPVGLAHSAARSDTIPPRRADAAEDARFAAIADVPGGCDAV